LHVVSEHRIPVLVWLGALAEPRQPPFFELERMIDCGLSRASALNRLAAQRRLADRSAMADRLRPPCRHPLMRDAALG
jgi:hypothetical protein